MSFMKRAIHLSCALALSLPFANSAMASASPYFGSAEHVFLGDKVKIFFSSNDPGKMNHVFQLPSGLKLTYGEILSFGDFYEIYQAPIAFGSSEADRRARFLAAYHSFSDNPDVVPEATQILDVIHDEEHLLLDGIKNGKTSEEIYKSLGHQYDIKFNCITGGGCDELTWITNKGRYLKLAMDDFDHFGDYAWIAYQTGHKLALEEAVLAHQTGNLNLLETAYAMNAFASHFLSDRAATGHMRTPRKELTDNVTPSFIGDLLATYMHQEENSYGLHVHNLAGDHWIAYGDKSYLSAKNEVHRQKINDLLQASSNEIFDAFQLGTTQIQDKVQILLPEPDEKGNASNIDISPLFYWDNNSKQLMRRNDLGNLYDRHWTASWFGWKTLADLVRDRGTLSEQDQSILALSAWGKKAVQSGFITNKSLILYVKTH